MREQHGGKAAHPRLYRIWKGMRRRCQNPNEPRYADYGGRGIFICEDWQLFSGFRDWSLAHGYADDLSIDRQDNDGPYSPENCRWATDLVQARNSRHVHWVEAFGERKSISAWAEDERCSISMRSLNARILRGWPTEFAITSPPATRSGVARKLGQKSWETERPKLPTKCRKGHEYTEYNTLSYNGKRQCRACRNFHLEEIRSGKKSVKKHER